MNYDLTHALEILRRTPDTLWSMLEGVSDDWTRANEGGESWSAYDILGHLVHGERTDWIARMKMIIEHGVEKTFLPFDRLAQFEESKGKLLHDLLKEFKILRDQNIKQLSSLYDETMLDKPGMHPSLGQVTMRNLLATWAVHDLNHLAQIARVIAHQYEGEVGPWQEYLPILQPKR